MDKLLDAFSKWDQGGQGLFLFMVFAGIIVFILLIVELICDTIRDVWGKENK